MMAHREELAERIDYRTLGILCRERRQREKLSLREVAKITGISASTLSRVENDLGQLDLIHVVKLANWLNIEVSRITGAPVEDIPQVVKTMLFGDPKLGHDEAKALAATFTSLYRQMSRNGLKGKVKE